MNPLKCAFGVHAGAFLCFVVHKKDKNKPKQVEDYTYYKASIKQKATSIFFGKNKLLENIHLESKGKYKNILTTVVS